MKYAEQVTFGGSGLDRAAELRKTPKALAEIVARGKAQSLLLWRGKLLCNSPAHDRLVRLQSDHPVLSQSDVPPVFLGREDDGVLVFAHDISNWMPEGVDAAALNSFLDKTEQQHPDLPQDTGFVELRQNMVRLSARDAELAATAKAVLGWHKTHRFCARCGHESNVISAGWQRICPSCGGHHFPRTDPVVIMLITSGGKTLLGRSPGWPTGMYSCLAGFIEPGESIEAAVRREVYEESGIIVGHVSYLSSQPWAFPASLMLGCHGEALNEEINTDPDEIEDAIWVSKSELMSAFAGENPVLLPARKGSIANFLLRNWLADTLD